ncbi:MAG: hypothetical protein JKY52_10490 [Flavobacteriales bacterium]|nr:hypothetical protein [Flavobacteriales bacterium]
MTIWFIGFAYAITALFVRGKKALSIFPDPEGVKILFQDKMSGYSTKSRMTKRGGANKVLHIVVTDEELWLKSNWIFAGIGTYYDLIHKVKRANITNVEGKEKSVIVDFLNDKGENKQVVLITRKLDELFSALNN